MERFLTPSSWQQSTSMQRMVPPCSICESDSSGIHFGVDSCSACSAFFRRTVVLKKSYTCFGNGECCVLQKICKRQKCRTCRFKKCLNVGMNTAAVRVATNGTCPKIEAVDEGSGTDLETLSPTTSTGIYPHSDSFLVELIKRQNYLEERRQLYLSEENIVDWLDNSSSKHRIILKEVENLKNNFFHLWTVESRLAAEYIHLNRFFNGISVEDKVKIYKTFFVIRQAVEEPHMTYKHGGLERCWVYMSNRRFIDIKNIDKYGENGRWSGSKHDFDMLKQTLVTMYSSEISNVGYLMKNLEISETEVILLLGLALSDTEIDGISEDTRWHLVSIRDRLNLDIFTYYARSGVQPHTRINNLLSVFNAVKAQALKNLENMQVIHCLKLVPLDNVFDDILLKNGINALV